MAVFVSTLTAAIMALHSAASYGVICRFGGIAAAVKGIVKWQEGLCYMKAVVQEDLTGST